MSNQDETLASPPVDVEHHVLMGESLERLRNNKDFQTVILDGYLKDKVIASVSLLAVPAIKNQGQRPDIMEDIVSASNLQYFFQQIDMMYESIKDPILSDEELEELDAETEGVH